MGGVGRVVGSVGDTGLVPRVLGSVAEAVDAPYVAVRDVRGEVVARHGEATGRPTIVVPLTYAGEELGALEVAAPRRGFADAGHALLAALAPQVAVVVRAAALNAELTDAQRHLVDAAQAERSRLRRDLHDGLAPSLSGVALGLEAAQAALRRDADRTEQILGRLRTEVSGALPRWTRSGSWAPCAGTRTIPPANSPWT